MFMTLNLYTTAEQPDEEQPPVEWQPDDQPPPSVESLTLPWPDDGVDTLSLAGGINHLIA